MPLIWNEIKERAVVFANEYKNDTYEKGEAQTFWNAFFDVFGVSRKRLASFEMNRKRLGQHHGFIDLFWPGVLLAEHKSAGEDLGKAAEQANDYIVGLKDREVPRYVIVSDFQRIHLYDYEAESEEERFFECNLKDFPKYVKRFGFIAGRENHKIIPEDPVNTKAVKAVEKLYASLQGSNYGGHELKTLLVRLVYCFFADDTLIWDKDLLRNYLELQTSEDGSDLGPKLSLVFEVLNTPKDARQNTLDEELQALPFVDGHLFNERLRLPSFNAKMRDILLDCLGYDWARVSPAIFGSMFQNITDDKARRDLGAHYTTESNILKVVNGLFMDDLRKEFEEVRHSARRVEEFQNKLSSLKFLDPACGCGNFLVVTYRELRLLELEAIKILHPQEGQRVFLNVTSYSKINVDQFYGIEIEEFPARIAEMALWVTDHQMNVLLGEHFGQWVPRLPLNTSPNIKMGVSALGIDWETVVPKKKLTYILGNPPFIGAKVMSDDKRAEIITLFGSFSGSGELDYVAGWYQKASEFIRDTSIEVAFVSTNSVTQGQQVGDLWGYLLKKGIVINFAHRTFKWTSEAKGKAAVFCVIIGFSINGKSPKYIYEYETPDAEPFKLEVKHINPYLIDADDVLIMSRNKPLSDVPRIGIGNQPIDNGHYLFSTEEKFEFLKREPSAASYFRRWLGSAEFINGWERWCLWLGDCPPQKLREMPAVMERVEAVREFRLASKRKATRRLADTPTRFLVENIPKTSYLVIPEVSSERRHYIPIGYLGPETLASNKLRVFPEAKMYHFGILTSLMHMAWMRHVCGRLKSDYSYSIDVVYNNFPWPEGVSDNARIVVEQAAQGVLDARLTHPGATLADLYDPNSMPKDLRDAHNVLDAAVDRSYGKKGFKTEMERLEFLFELYRKYVIRSDSEADGGS